MKLVRSAIAPETMVAAVAQNTVWNNRNVGVGRSKVSVPEAKKLNPPKMALLPPNIMPKPMIQYKTVPKQKSIKFFIMMLPAFFALVNPASTKVKPACMKNTRKAPNNVQITSTDEYILPTLSFFV